MSTATVTLRAAPSAPAHLPAARRRAPLPPAWVGLLVVLDLAVAGSGLWLGRVVAAVLVALLPGQLALQALRVPAASVRRFPVYLVASSVVVLPATGLGVDLVGPLLGAHAPLRRLPLTVALDVVIALLGLAGRRAPRSCRVVGADVVARARWLWPLLWPLASIAAAARLDAGRGNTVAVAVLVAVALLVPACAVAAPRMHRQHLSLVVYGAGLAVMLLTSMRTAYVVGYDISSEYADFHRTVTSGVWHGGHLGPYEAMLSLTVLPASLHALVGGQDVFIFKLFYPALFALFPVAVFWLASWILSRRGAFVAAAVVLVQYYFFQQQPEIARQEIGLLVFAALVGALLDRSLGRPAQLALVATLAAALVVCHYSTSYVAIVECLSVALLAGLGSLSRARRVPALPWLVAALVTAGVAVAWYVPVTHSTSNLTFVAQTFKRKGIAILPGRQKGESVFSAYFNGVRQAPPTVASYQRDIATLYGRYERFIVPLPGATAPRFDLRPAASADLSGRFPGLAGGLSTAELVIQQAVNALGALGALVLALRRRSGVVARAIGYAGLAATAVLAASRLSGTVAADYNSSRLFLQCLLVYAVAEVALIETALARWRALRVLRPVALCGFALALAVAFLANSGLSAPLVGGGPPFVLYNAGEDFNRLDVSAPEQAAAEWLASAVPAKRVVYADNYGVLRLDEFTPLNQAVFTAITPRTLDQHAWVYATRSNVVGHLTWGQTSHGQLDVAFPASFLADEYDVVYSSGTTEVFHR